MYSFQRDVNRWLLNTFGPSSPQTTTKERSDRFLEEVFELLQALDYPPERISKIAEYVYGRPVGDKRMEAGAVLLTLAALANAEYIDLDEEMDNELYRVSTPEMMEKIRAKSERKNEVDYKI